jgi:quercetin dioxygenase-like cupin family protein
VSGVRRRAAFHRVRTPARDPAHATSHHHPNAEERMSPVQHAVTGHVLSFSLADEMRTVRGELGAARERIGRTLVKDGPLRVTLVAVGPGGALEPHRADGPISVHVLDGEIAFEAEGRTWTLGPGDLLALERGIPHAVRSERGGVFLLTVVLADRGATAAPHGADAHAG